MMYELHRKGLPVFHGNLKQLVKIADSTMRRCKSKGQRSWAHIWDENGNMICSISSRPRRFKGNEEWHRGTRGTARLCYRFEE